ncbi:electron transfer flavoprotein subunit alpha/FixB family protein [Egicoccus sp. AB-alg2]|uniref:electron transfer flavoprotein subunit alpha/FixB family protein n=1 Tax=Egicoccus sp. AB-alg2 TaxID=3242693 RepID=UPI00359E0A13
MSGVLALLDLDREGLAAGPTERLLTFARRVAEADGVPLEAVMIGALDGRGPAILAAQGVEVVHVVDAPLLADYAPAAWAAAVVQVLGASAARVLLAPASARGNEVLAHLAARTDLPMAANVVALQPAADGWELTRHRWGGILLEDAHLAAEVALATVVAHTVTAEPAASPGSAEVRATTPELTDELTVGRVREHVRRTAGVGLATASVVVAGGRGVGSAEGFAALEELAELLGGAVGCSRVATNNGWRSHNDQVGQTGTRVAPDLYIALGISGATQHWVGCMAAKRILAVNTDPDAPMVTRADYAVIGDLHPFVAALVEEVRKRKSVPV